jgi:hypothetical protein
LTGMCLIALAIACWPGGDSRSASYGMLMWSILAMLYLIIVGLGGNAGILLWPAVAVHAGLSVLLLWARWREHQRTATLDSGSRQNAHI